MSDRDKKAYELAADVVKQILGLATAIVAVTATLLKDVISVHVPLSWTVIVGAWTLLIISIGFGIRTLQWLATNMWGPDDVRLPQLNDANLVRAARIHVATFVVALILLAIFGMIELLGATVRMF